MEQITIPLDQLVPDEDNPRIHDRRNLDLIRRSVEMFGQYRPLVVQRSTMRIAIGNGLYLVLRELDWNEAEAWVLDLTDDQLRALSIVDNRSHDTSSFDPAALAALIEEYAAELTGDIGFSAEELEELRAAMGATPETERYRRTPAADTTAEPVKFVFGPYQFYIERPVFDEWIGRLRVLAGGEEELKSLLLTRIGLEVLHGNNATSA